jgi:hypothetical protein
MQELQSANKPLCPESCLICCADVPYELGYKWLTASKKDEDDEDPFEALCAECCRAYDSLPVGKKTVENINSVVKMTWYMDQAFEIHKHCIETNSDIVHQFLPLWRNILHNMASEDNTVDPTMRLASFASLTQATLILGER